MRDARPLEALRLLLRRLSVHSTLNAEEQQAVMGLPGTVAPLKAQTDFLRAGEWVDTSCLIESGLVARVEDLADGRRQYISLHLPGDFVDLPSMWLTNAPATLQAIGSATVVRVPHAALRDAAARWPAINAALWRDDVLDAAMVAQAVVRVGQRDAFSRMAHLFCELAVRFDRVGLRNGMSFRFLMTQEQISYAVGLTSVHVNRTLKALRGSGLCTLSSGRVEITDWPGLQRAAGFDPAYLSLRQASSPRARMG